MERIKKFILIIVIVLVAFFYAHIDKNYYLYDRNQDSSEYVSTGILEDGMLSQKFVAESDNLDGINIKTSVYGDADKVKILYQIFDVSTNEVVAEGEVEGIEIKSGKFLNIKFDRVTDVRDKEYLLQIEEEGADDANGIGFSIGASKDSEVSKELLIKGKNTEGSLICRVIEHRFDVETFVMFLVFVVYIVVFMKVLYKMFK